MGDRRWAGNSCQKEESGAVDWPGDLVRRPEGGDRGWDGWRASPTPKFEQTPGDGAGKGSLACCSPLCHKVGHDWATEQQLFKSSDAQTQGWWCGDAWTNRELPEGSPTEKTQWATPTLTSPQLFICKLQLTEKLKGQSNEHPFHCHQLLTNPGPHLLYKDTTAAGKLFL